MKQLVSGDVRELFELPVRLFKPDQRLGESLLAFEQLLSNVICGVLFRMTVGDLFDKRRSEVDDLLIPSHLAHGPRGFRDDELTALTIWPTEKG